MAFSFIKKQMDYNRERYEAEIEKKREGGRKSAAARQKEPDNAEAASTEPNTSKECLTDLNTLQHSSTESTDNDIVIDNDIDDDKYLTLPLGVGGDQEILVRNAYMDVFFGNPESSAEFVKRWETNPEELRETCETVLDEWTVFNEAHVSAEDARKHFVSAVRTRYEKKIRQGKKKTPKVSKASGKVHAGARKNPKAEEPDIERLDRQQKERDEAFERQERDAVKPAVYIRSLGYDPEKVTMIQVLNPEWRAKHPPTLSTESA